MDKPKEDEIREMHQRCVEPTFKEMRQILLILDAEREQSEKDVSEAVKKGHDTIGKLIGQYEEKITTLETTNKALQVRVEKLEGTLSSFANCDDPDIECEMDSIEAENYVSLWFTAVMESRKALAPEGGCREG